MFTLRTTPHESEAEPAQLAHAEPGILALLTELRLRGHAELPVYFGDLHRTVAHGGAGERDTICSVVSPSR